MTYEKYGKYDYIIAGAGAAGCVIAARLATNTSAKVLLLEAGGSNINVPSMEVPAAWVHNIGSEADYQFEYAPSSLLNNRKITLACGKILGGGGSINGMLFARGHHMDYDGWAEAGNTGWDYQSVLPLFNKMEIWEGGQGAYHGAHGPLRVEHAKELDITATAFIEAAGSFGMPYLADSNVPSPEGVGPESMNVRDGKRCSSATAYLNPLMDAGQKNLTVLADAKVLKLNFNGTRCTGLWFIMNGRSYSADVSSEVILSAGAINTPRILMLSGVGPQAELTRLGIPVVADLPGVGQNFQDHPMVTGVCFEANQSLLPNNNLAGSLAFWKSRKELTSPDLMFLNIHVPFVTAAIAAKYPPPPNSFVITPSLVLPQSRGYVRMRTALHDGPMEIQPNFLSEEADREALISAVEIVLQIAEQPAFKAVVKSRVAPAPLDPLDRSSIMEFLKDACNSYNHPVGTCAMGTGDDSVVNSQLQVNGIASLRIADASIMPRITSANTFAPTVMIGEFASRLITGK
jgi:choline dehydrogenase